MKIINASNPKWADAAQTMIVLDVEFAGLGVVPFGASPDDVEPHGVELFTRAAAGEFGPVAAMPAKTQVQIDDETARAVKAELAALDLASIRDLRAYIAAKADAPASLKDREAAAVVARSTLPPASRAA